MCCDSSPLSCCGSKVGVVHVVAGVGLGFLAVSYLGLGDVTFWGWLLVGVGLVAHFVLPMKCEHC